MNKLSTLLVIAGSALLASACSDEQKYVGDNGAIHQVALTADTKPVFMTDEDALYIVETRAELPIRAPSAAELNDLTTHAASFKKLPFPRLPWVERGDLELEVDFTVSNLDKVDHDVDVTVNGANEFDEYFPGIVVVEENALPMHAQWERRYTVKAMSRVTRTVRQEELDEVATDLATVVNGAPNPDEIVYFENKSDSDPRSEKYVPAIIPGLIAMRLGLRASQAGKILLEATVRATDAGGKLAEDGDTRMHVNPKPFHAMPPDDAAD